jgi:hypothetical protein
MSRRGSFSTSVRNHRHIDGHTKVNAARADKTATHQNGWLISRVTATRIKLPPLTVPFVGAAQKEGSACAGLKSVPALKTSC